MAMHMYPQKTNSSNETLCNLIRNDKTIYLELAKIPGFARDSRSVIIHVLVAVFLQFNM